MALAQAWVRGALRGEAAAVDLHDGHVVLRVACPAGTVTLPFHGGAALKLAEQLLAAGRYVLIPPREPEARARRDAGVGAPPAAAGAAALEVPA